VHGGTVNDVALATVAGALRGWLLQRGEQVAPSLTVRALVPVSVSDGEAPGANRVSTLLVDLPVGESQPLRRLAQISTAMAGHHQSGRSVSADALVAISGFAPPTLHALGARAANGLTRRMFRLVVTNVPGPQVPLYVAGARLTEMFPILPLGPGQAVSIGRRPGRDARHRGARQPARGVPRRPCRAEPDRRGARRRQRACARDPPARGDSATGWPGAARAAAVSTKRPRPRRAIVLGGGGVLGFAWMLGALSALQEVAGFDVRDVELIVGTSAGSVTAGLLGCGVPLDAICRHHQGVPAPADPPIAYSYGAATGGALPPRPGLRPGSPRLLLDGLRHPWRLSPIVLLAGLLPAGRGTLAPVHGLMATVARDAGFAESWPTRPRPWVVTADYRTGRRVVFGRDSFAAQTSSRGTVPRIIRRASLADAVTASCSIPAWYPPTVIDGVPYIDGGTISNASVDLLLGTDLDEVYVLAPMASVAPDRARTALGRIERAVRRTITRGILADVAALGSAGPRTFVVTPEAADLAVIGLNLMNPARRTEVLETAEVTASAQLTTQLSASTAGARNRPRYRAPGQEPA